MPGNAILTVTITVRRVSMDAPATVTSKGQVTLPKAVRDALGLKAGDEVLFRIHKDRAVLAKVPDFLELKGSVPVPPISKGASWKDIKAETWRRRTASRH
jgi:antitoxin PrlF